LEQKARKLRACGLPFFLKRTVASTASYRFIHMIAAAMTTIKRDPTTTGQPARELYRSLPHNGHVMLVPPS
jgi:hypothetical protein